MFQKLDVTIRRAEPDDAGLLSDLGVRTFSETFAADNTAENIAAYLSSSSNFAQQTNELADPAATFLIAEVDGAAAGYAKLRAGKPAEEIQGAKPIELVRLYVSREWLGRGVGEALISACVVRRSMPGTKPCGSECGSETRGHRLSTESGIFGQSASMSFSWARTYRRTS
jgi:diamine N-acetyltransferase